VVYNLKRGGGGIRATHECFKLTMRHQTYANGGGQQTAEEEEVSGGGEEGLNKTC